MVFIMQIYVDHVFITDRRRAVIGPICRYSDQLPISIRYGHADWDAILTRWYIENAYFYMTCTCYAICASYYV